MDKLAVLDNESVVLMQDCSNKEKLSKQTKQKCTTALSDRDKLKLELIKLGNIYRIRQDEMEEQVRGFRVRTMRWIICNYWQLGCTNFNWPRSVMVIND